MKKTSLISFISLTSLISLLILIIVTAAIMILNMESFAGDSAWYGGGSLGFTHSKDFVVNDVDYEASGVMDDTSFGWKVFQGYHFNKYFSAELAYADLGDIVYKAVVTAPVSGAFGGKIETKGLSITPVGTLLLNENLGILGKAGIFIWDTDHNLTNNSVGIFAAPGKDGTASIFGMGAKYDINTKISIRGEWERFNDISVEGYSKINIDLFSTGIVYRY
ncbi:outer membrane beta-barrel protein [bacterium]|nr:outer membrane beta-barrel protein [bacterium]